MQSVSKQIKPRRLSAAGSYLPRLKKDIKRNYLAYLLALPAIIIYLLFSYKPMYGVIIAFKDFSPAVGIMESDWTSQYGFQHFIDFFSSYYFWRLLKNTIVISVTSIVFAFPAPIILALLLNEIPNERFKRVTQTITYMPHFISLVVVAGLIKILTSNTGAVVQLMSYFGFTPVSLLSRPQYFVPLYVISGIWENVGWGSIIYLAALTGIDSGLYEAARIDGAGRWKQALYVTLPGISSTIIIMLLFRLGSVMSVGYEKIILLYNEGIYDTADVISTFVFRRGLQQYQWSYSTAVGLFNSVINFILILIFNRISRNVSEVSLW